MKLQTKKKTKKLNRKTRSLEKLLVGNPWIMDYILDGEVNFETKFGSSLLILFHKNNKAEELIDMATKQLQKYKIDLLRTNEAASLIFIEYCRISSFNYIKKVVGPILEKYIMLDLPFSTIDHMENLKINEILISRFIQDLMDGIFESRKDFPQSMLYLLKYITLKLNIEESNSGLTNDYKYQVVSMILFLRILVPFIIDPIKTGLLDKDLELRSNTRKTLLEVSKIIQIIANGVEIEKDHPMFNWLNRFQPYQIKMKVFISELMKNVDGIEYAYPKFKKRVLKENSKLIFQVINKNLDSIVKNMSKVTQLNKYGFSPSSFIKPFIKVMNKCRLRSKMEPYSLNITLLPLKQLHKRPSLSTIEGLKSFDQGRSYMNVNTVNSKNKNSILSEKKLSINGSCVVFSEFKKHQQFERYSNDLVEKSRMDTIRKRFSAFTRKSIIRSKNTSLDLYKERASFATNNTRKTVGLELEECIY